jgi:IS605 OrfB family transposase
MILSYSEKFQGENLEKKIFYEICSIAKCIYNSSLYNQRQYYRESEGKYLEKTLLYQKIRDEVSRLYKKLNSWVSQRIIFQVDLDYQNFFKAFKVKKEYQIVRPPKYKKKGKGLVPVVFAGPALKQEEKTLRLSLSKYLRNKFGSKFLTIEIPSFLEEKEISEVTIIPIGYSQFEIKYTYEVEEKKSEGKEVLALDLGLNNIAAGVTTKGEAFLFSGKWLKSQNRFYNKKAAEFQSQIDTEKNPLKKMKLIFHKKMLTKKRNRKVKDEIHKISFNLIKFCAENEIGKIVIGHNQEWKQEINIGKRNNQNFVQIPHSKLITYITYKAKLQGIAVEEIEESYTSKTDSLAFESIQKQEKYLGKRIKRGLFKSSIGKSINADINAAINILRKCIGDSLSNLEEIISRGCVFHPWKFEMKRSIHSHLKPTSLPL